MGCSFHYMFQWGRDELASEITSGQHIINLEREAQDSISRGKILSTRYPIFHDMRDRAKFLLMGEWQRLHFYSSPIFLGSLSIS
jgi:hypothetical protein